ncbi:hypothetical protein V8C86DRAFT_1626911 [Haematococcus lacustris]
MQGRSPWPSYHSRLFHAITAGMAGQVQAGCLDGTILPDSAITVDRLIGNAAAIGKVLSRLVCPESEPGRPAHATSRASRPPLIGLHVEQSIEYITLVLACLAAGAAFLPLDPAWPPASLQDIQRQARPSLIITAQPQVWSTPHTRLQTSMLPCGTLSVQLDKSHLQPGAGSAPRTEPGSPLAVGKGSEEDPLICMADDLVRAAASIAVTAIDEPLSGTSIPRGCYRGKAELSASQGSGLRPCDLAAGAGDRLQRGPASLLLRAVHVGFNRPRPGRVLH